MSTPSLTPTSYLVLGLVAGMGPVTPYDMKQMVGISIGYFWSFPHSQLYAEPDRLVDAGLLDVEQEAAGRRRKRYSITADGRRALEAWLADPSSEVEEIRSMATLKLFFGALARSDDVVALAEQQVRARRENLDVYRRIERAVGDDAEFRFPLATLRLGMKVEQAELEFWQDIAANPPG